ncbi:MAG: hypothetical protein HGA67_01210 [Candidatus Yonathbacteria bacterium]|nr:hypothetical protein [Candidatus Yonathbacteria bacterium]
MRFFPTIFIHSLVISLLIGALYSAPCTVSASESYVSTTVNPAYPEAGKDVSVVLKSYAIDLTRATVTWYVNEKRILSGIGETNFSTKASDVGKTMTIRATIVSDTETIEKNISFVPGGADLLWEATDSYTPPFYRGKSLPASNAAIKVVALPYLVNSSGTRISDDSLIYTWNKNGFKRDVSTQSGYGKNVLSITKDILLSKESIGVEVSSRDGRLGAASSIIIPQTNPKILFYENRPLQGPWYSTTLQSQINLVANEITMLAEPYFFSYKKNMREGLTFLWRVNGKNIGSDWNDPRSILFGIEKGTSGTASTSVEITNTSKLLQSGHGNLTIIFDDKDSVGANALFR